MQFLIKEWARGWLVYILDLLQHAVYILEHVVLLTGCIFKSDGYHNVK